MKTKLQVIGIIGVLICTSATHLQPSESTDLPNLKTIDELRAQIQLGKLPARTPRPIKPPTLSTEITNNTPEFVTMLMKSYVAGMTPSPKKKAASIEMRVKELDKFIQKTELSVKEAFNITKNKYKTYVQTNFELNELRERIAMMNELIEQLNQAIITFENSTEVVIKSPLMQQLITHAPLEEKIKKELEESFSREKTSTYELSKALASALRLQVTMFNSSIMQEFNRLEAENMEREQKLTFHFSLMLDERKKLRNLGIQDINISDEDKTIYKEMIRGIMLIIAEDLPDSNTNKAHLALLGEKFDLLSQEDIAFTIHERSQKRKADRMQETVGLLKRSQELQKGRSL